MAMSTDRALNISERDKYEHVWSTHMYRAANRGEKRYEAIRGWLRHVGAKKVVDLGIGTGRLAKMLSSEFDMSGVDIAYNSLDEGVDIPVTVAALWDDLNIGTFDAVICTDVLEHIPKPLVPRAIENIGRLAPHGYLTIGLTPERMKFEFPLHMTIESVEWWDSMIPFATVGKALFGGGIARY